MALDTDIKDPDSHLQVTFYLREVRNEYKSAELEMTSGKPENEKDLVDYIKIQIPGNRNLEIDTPAREEHKKRFHMHWAAYQNGGGSSGRIIGTPIEQWPRIATAMPGVAEELRALRFNTVQAVAGASDAQLQSIGMIAGQNAFTFRDDARRFLAVSEAESKLSDADKKHSEADAKLAEANAKMLAQQEQHAKDMQEMNEKMKAMMNMLEESSQKRGPGRPAREVE